jgi:hypothetical protein
VSEGLFRPQLGEPHHHAYLVEDIEATVDRLVDRLGAGPFFLVERVPLENVFSRGEPAEFVHNSAFGFCGGGAIELIEAISLAPARVEKGFSAPWPRIPSRKRVCGRWRATLRSRSSHVGVMRRPAGYRRLMARTIVAVSLALCVAGVVLLAVGSAVLVTAVGWALVGIAGVLLVSLAFLLVGESEDRDRARHPHG